MPKQSFKELQKEATSLGVDITGIRSKDALKEEIAKVKPEEEPKEEVKEEPKSKKSKEVKRPRTKKDDLYDMRVELASMIAVIKKDMQQEGSNVYRNSAEVALNGLEQAHAYMGVSIEKIGGELPKGYREEINK